VLTHTWGEETRKSGRNGPELRAPTGGTSRDALELISDVQQLPQGILGKMKMLLKLIIERISNIHDRRGQPTGIVLKASVTIILAARRLENLTIWLAGTSPAIESNRGALTVGRTDCPT
jgi:hypothetical protein